MQYYLESVDTTNNTGVVYYKLKSNDPYWIKVNVNISPLLMWRIKNEATNSKDNMLPGQSYLKTVFESSPQSPEYHKNPFQVIAYKPNNVGSDKDVIRKYISMELKAVDEGQRGIPDPITGRIAAYRSYVKSKANYLRWSHIEYKLTSNRSSNLVFARPLKVKVS